MLNMLIKAFQPFGTLLGATCKGLGLV